MGCYSCMSVVPWSSLIAVALCWGGTALFCGAGHEAMTKSESLLSSAGIPEFDLSETLTDEAFQALKYYLYGLAGFILLLTILLFVDGLVTTKYMKNDYETSCKTTCCGVCVGVMYSVISFLVTLIWLLSCLFSVLPVLFFVTTRSQCSFIGYLDRDSLNGKENVCVDFVQTGIMQPQTNTTASYGRLCGDDLRDVCNQPEFFLTFQLYIIALAGAVTALISMIFFLMSLSANFAYIKMTRKLAVYEDAKYREEMELNDIINTARSNERLTYKY